VHSLFHDKVTDSFFVFVLNISFTDTDKTLYVQQ
jgi:hypothetical protein